MTLEVDSVVETRKAELNTGRVDAVLCEPTLGLYALASGAEHPEGGQPSCRIFLNTLLSNASALASLVSDKGANWNQAKHVFQEVFQLASGAIRESFGEDEPDTSATVLLMRESEAAVAHVGTTRAYCLRGGRVVRLTHDHREGDDHEDKTLVPVKKQGFGEQSLGQSAPLTVDGITFRLAPNTVIALISEGVSGIVRGEQLLKLQQEARGLGSLAVATVTAAARRQVVADSTAVLVGLGGEARVVDDEDETIPQTRVPLPDTSDVLPRGRNRKSGSGAKSGSGGKSGSGAASARPASRRSTPQPAPARKGAAAPTSTTGEWRRRTSTMAYALKHKLFEGLDEEQTRAALRIGVAVTLRPGEILYESGEDANKVYILQQGSLEEPKSGHRWNTGEIVGARGLLPKTLRRLTLRAVDDCRLLAFRRDKLEGLMERDPKLAAILFRNLARCLVH